MDSDDQRLAEAVLTLMDATENAGKPLVAIDGEGRRENYFRLAISMTGRARDIDEVIHLMQAKYPNAGISDSKDTEVSFDLDDGFMKKGDA